MKKLAVIIFLTYSYSIQAQEIEHLVSSEIAAVTVYLQGAQITRSFSATASAGNSILVIGDLPADIQEKSIQVKPKRPDIKVLSVSTRLNYLDEREKSEQLQTLEKQRKEIQYQLSEEQSWLDVFNEEESVLKRNKSIGGQQSGVRIEELKQATDYFRIRLADIKSRRLEVNKKIEVLKDRLSKINAQLNELNNKAQEPVREILIKVNTPKLITSGFELSYSVKDAGWLPSYDIRAKDVQSPIAITYKASVFQHTGENWERVKLTFSNADPSQSGASPILKTWFLNFNNRLANYDGYIPPIANNEVTGRVVSAEDGMSLPGVNVVIKGSTVGTVTDIDGFYRLPLTGDAATLVFSFVGLETQEVGIGGRGEIDVALNADVQQLSEVIVTGMAVTGSSYYHNDSYHYERKVKREIAATPVIRQTTLEFQVSDPYTIISDGKCQVVDMVEYELPASYQYYCVPKLDQDAFLKARITDWDDYNFLAGEASLFFEGKFIGKTVLDTRNVKDTLDISLGRDKNIVITREKVKGYASTQFIGGNRKEQIAFTVDIRNKKQQPVSIIIEDQIPVSSNKEIEVSILENSKADYDDKTGRLKWKMDLDPGNAEQLKMGYQVKYPKGSRLVLE